ncbi:MAG TPA: diguanylate cyclase [Micromonosporaceae bacterium]|nr:diguanylate cyclase [Micromonosporaceae bacterium]
MTLRGRLTNAFLAVVLGPLLFGALFVGGTLTAVSHERSVDRLNLAAATVRTSISALCQQLRAAADAVAVVADPAARATAANHVVKQQLAAAVVITDAAGAVVRTPDAPPHPWLDCAGSNFSDLPPQALAVRVEVRDRDGTVLGEVTAAQRIDTALVARLSAATGAGITVLSGRDNPVAAYSTESGRNRSAVLAAAAGLQGDSAAQTDNGQYVRRVGPSPGQPLPLVLSVPLEQPPGLYAVLMGAVAVAGLCSVLAAWWLARSTTRPLAELAHAVERVAEGDLTARVPVRGQDEVGQLAATFNRMARETQAYVQALTASRDQLRGHVAILGDTLSSTHNLQRILKLILQTALAATSARAGVVLLLDPGTRTLIGQVAEGVEFGPPEQEPASEGAEPDPATLRVPLGSGLLGAVAAAGEPRWGRVDRDQPEFCSDEPRCETYLAVPVAAPDAVDDPAGPDGLRATDRVTGRWPTNLPPALGVLAVYDRLGADEFDDGDLATLCTFAGQAAIAVDNVRMHDEAQRLALTDPLTGLRNYRYLKTSIRREIERASRFQRRLAVLALDLDRFKEVNDTYGHAAGDKVLAEFARRIRSVVREVDLAFRQGGEEFIVLLPETDTRGGEIVAGRLGAAIRDTPIMVHPHPGALAEAAASPIRVTVSIGIAVYPDHATTAQQLLDAADEALYAAKAAGRDTYRTADGNGGPAGEEIPVPAGAATVDENASGAGSDRDSMTGSGSGGVTSAAQPPRQSRGR